MKNIYDFRDSKSFTPLPQYKLKGLGYTDTQIDILKSYQKGKILSEHELRGISGTYTGTIKLKNCGTKYAEFYYEWTWDHAPIITASDSFAMRWLAYDSSGHEFDIDRKFRLVIFIVLILIFYC